MRDSSIHPPFIRFLYFFPSLFPLFVLYISMTKNVFSLLVSLCLRFFGVFRFLPPYLWRFFSSKDRSPSVSSSSRLLFSLFFFLDIPRITHSLSLPFSFFVLCSSPLFFSFVISFPSSFRTLVPYHRVESDDRLVETRVFIFVFFFGQLPFVFLVYFVLGFGFFLLSYFFFFCSYFSFSYYSFEFYSSPFFWYRISYSYSYSYFSSSYCCCCCCSDISVFLLSVPPPQFDGFDPRAYAKHMFLVTGGSGVVGARIVSHLIQHGARHIRVFDLVPPKITRLSTVVFSGFHPSYFSLNEYLLLFTL